VGPAFIKPLAKQNIYRGYLVGRVGWVIIRTIEFGEIVRFTLTMQNRTLEHILDQLRASLDMELFHNGVLVESNGPRRDL
jgi:hypothetical protein